MRRTLGHVLGIRIARSALWLLPCALISASLPAQQVSSTTSTAASSLPGSTLTTPVRDPQAVALVQQSLAAMGAGAASTILNAQVQGTLAPTAGSDVPSGNFTWLDDFSGPTFEFRHELDTTEAVRVEVSGHGSPAVEQGTTVNALPPRMTLTDLPFHLPVIVLNREFADTKYSIRMGDSVTVEGRPALQVIIRSQATALDQALSEQHWDFDATSGLPVRIEYRLPSGIYTTDWIQAADELSNYRITSGMAVPYQVTIFEDGVAQATAQISAVAFNTGVASSLFDSPLGGAQ